MIENISGLSSMKNTEGDASQNLKKRNEMVKLITLVLYRYGTPNSVRRSNSFSMTW